jgi:hypothetical protein
MEKSYGGCSEQFEHYAPISRHLWHDCPLLLDAHTVCRFEYTRQHRSGGITFGEICNYPLALSRL